MLGAFCPVGERNGDIPERSIPEMKDYSKYGVLAPGEAQERRKRCDGSILETFHSNPAGKLNRHESVGKQFQTLWRKLHGHFLDYDGLIGNFRCQQRFRHQVLRADPARNWRAAPATAPHGPR